MAVGLRPGRPAGAPRSRSTPGREKWEWCDGVSQQMVLVVGFAVFWLYSIPLVLDPRPAKINWVRIALGYSGAVAVIAPSARGKGRALILRVSATVLCLAWYLSTALARDPLHLVLRVLLLLGSWLPEEAEEGWLLHIYFIATGFGMNMVYYALGS